MFELRDVCNIKGYQPSLFFVPQIKKTYLKQPLQTLSSEDMWSNILKLSLSDSIYSIAIL